MFPVRSRGNYRSVLFTPADSAISTSPHTARFYLSAWTSVWKQRGERTVMPVVPAVAGDTAGRQLME